MVKALTLEIGDSWEDIEIIKGLREFPDTKSPEEEKRVITVIRYTLQTRANNVKDENDE